MIARLFVAIDLPAGVRARLAAIAPRAEKGVRVVAEENLHVTLKFLGDAELEPVEAALERVRFAPFSWSIREVGSFSSARRGSTLWAGVTECEAGTNLHREIEDALASIGFERERRPFAPHVTLARCDLRAPRSVTSAFLEDHRSLSIPGIPVDTFVLKSSVLTRGGPEYTNLRRYGARS